MGNNNTGIKTSLWPRVFAELGRVAHCERARLVLQLALELRPNSPVSRACAIAISSGVGATKTGAAGAGGVAFVGGAVGAGAGAAML